MADAVDRTPIYKFPLPAFDRSTWHQYWEESWRSVEGLISRFFTLSNYTGAWQNSTLYNQGQRALDVDNSTIYTALTSHVSSGGVATFADDRIANPGRWEPYTQQVIFRGEWASLTDYAAGDFVTSGQDFAVAVSSHTSGLTFAADVAAGKWTVLIAGSTIVAFPALPGNALSFPRINAAETAFEYRTPTQVRGDINAQVAGSYQAANANLTTLAAVTPGAIGLALLDDVAAGNALTTLGITAFVQTLLDDATAAAFAATLGAPLLTATNIFSGAQPITIYFADNGAAGPAFVMLHDSATPAAFDFVGHHLFLGKDTAGNQQEYARQYAYIIDPTSTSEDGGWAVQIATAGAVTDAFWIESVGGVRSLTLHGQVRADSGVTGGFKGNGSINAIQLYEANVRVATLGANTFTTTQTIDGAQFPLSIKWQDNSATLGPELVIERISTSPAAADFISGIRFNGRDSAGNTETYTQIFTEITDPTNGSEDANLWFSTMVGGTLAQRFLMSDGFRSVGFNSPGAGNFGAATAYQVANTQVVGTRNTGWTAWTGTASKATRNADAPPTTTQIAQAVKAIIDALIGHGLIGA